MLVIIDSSTQFNDKRIPPVVKSAYPKKPIVPLLSITDPGFSKNYGFYAYKDLRKEKISKLYKPAKEALKEAIEEGTYQTEIAEPPVKEKPQRKKKKKKK